MTHSDETPFPSAGTVIAAFGGIRPMAARLDVPVSTVQGWKQRDAIPDNRIEDVRAAAAADGIDLNAARVLPPGNDDSDSGDDVQDPGDRPTDAGEAVAARSAVSVPQTSRDGGDAPKDDRHIGATSSGKGGGFLGFVALIVALATAGWVWWSQQQPAALDLDPRVAVLQTEIAELRRGATGLAELRASVKALADRSDAQPIDPSVIAGLEKRLDDMAQRLSSNAGNSGDAARIDRLETEFEDTKTAATSIVAAVSSLQSGVENVMGDISARLVAVETRTGRTEAVEARAVGLAIGVAELRRTMRSGAPFAADLVTLRALAADDAAVAANIEILAASAPAGLPTLQALTRDFENRVGGILAAGRGKDGATWYQRALDRASTVVSVRRVGADAAGDTADAIVARGEARLADGDLAGAIAQMSDLRGTPADVAAPWLVKAQTLQAAEQALAAINAHALATLASAGGG